MEYIDQRNGKTKKTNYLRLVNGETQYRVEVDNEKNLVITKINFDNDVITIKPMVRNQISIK